MPGIPFTIYGVLLTIDWRYSMNEEVEALFAEAYTLAFDLMDDSERVRKADLSSERTTINVRKEDWERFKYIVQEARRIKGETLRQLNEELS